MNSMRFHGKVLWKFHNLAMIEHVYRRACLALSAQHVYITSGDSEILTYMKSKGANVIKSNRTHNDGTSRAAEAVEKLKYNYVAVLQADEILIDPLHLIKLFDSVKTNKEIKYFNLVTNLNSDVELNDSNVVKCALNNKNEILFIFRQSPSKDASFKIFSKIMGTIIFERNSLFALTSSPDTPLQVANSTEQLKILELGYTLKAVNVESSYPSINIEDDIKIVQNFVKDNERQKIIMSEYVEL
jgi:3-deoxy-manno-octulosonate cytidylyltransferase (CMP-KDO synthetase)